ncbi:hypothetical protein MY04_0650 [Flammeovirga sp. MY04]|uniref:hypothetical protein n=1 Tax=Flammeovirga sp. MY04 TaxID=1191459 RepID=UPI000806394D|nr:hypothetical protein [Flammeovirga sp. MY04]ANQ48032.1 hypothetical protein MY04_0650 [Flammeovirga sp. MY04]
MKNLNNFLVKGVFFLSTLFFMFSCTANEEDLLGSDDDDTETPETPGGEEEEAEDISITSTYVISEDETWESGITVNWGGHVVIEEGVTLTIEPGVKVLADKTAAPEFYIKGNLHALGTADKPIYVTVPEADRTEANIFNLQAWGGFICTSTAKTFVMDHVVMEFGNATLTDDHISIQEGVVDMEVGEPSYGFYSENPETKVIVHNSVIAYMSDDAFRPQGGQVSFYNNVFAYIGSTGGEALNIKKGTTGDIAYNLFYHIATNGPKWSNKSGVDVQTNINAYNNTIVSGGWRRNKSGRGGSVNIEETARGMIVNNMIVNCRYGVRVVGDAVEGTNVDMENTTIDNQYYYGNHARMTSEFAPSNGFLTEIAENSIAGNDPMFENYDVVNEFTISLTTEDDEFPTPNEDKTFDEWSKYDFHLKSGSPALNAGSVNVEPMYGSITVAGKTYTVPRSADYIGAFGTK